MAAPTPTTTNPPPTTPSHPRTLRIGTRPSDLALAQVTLFTTLLSTTHPTLPTSTHPTHTSLGDTNKTTDLQTLASTGTAIWTEGLERELEENRIDCIVHSLKDVPTKLPLGFICAGVGRREESRDAVVLQRRHLERGGKGLGDLDKGAVVGTSSVRRAAMVRRRWPHLVIKSVRGNVGTRLSKLDDESNGFDAVVLAGAGMQRIGFGDRICSWLDGREGVLHAVGQGAVGVEWREKDEWVGELVGRVSRGRVRWECVAERALLRALEGGCSVPVGVECGWVDGERPIEAEREQGTEEQDTKVGQKNIDEGQGVDGAGSITPDDRERGGFLTMRAMVVSEDGKKCVEGTERLFVDSDAEAEECAWRMYKQLVDKGAEEMLKEVRLNRDRIAGQGGA